MTPRDPLTHSLFTPDVAITIRSMIVHATVEALPGETLDIPVEVIRDGQGFRSRFQTPEFGEPQVSIEAAIADEARRVIVRMQSQLQERCSTRH